MLRILILFAILLKGFQLTGQRSGEDVIKKMHQTYHAKYCKNIQFDQRNTHFQNDSVTGTSYWYEYISYPDKFKIEFSERNGKNLVIFRNDSVYSYRKGKLVRSAADENTLLLLLGGMYHRELKDVLERMKRAGYELKQLSSKKWKSKSYWIVGDSTSNHIYVNTKNLKIERIIEKMKDGSVMDMRFDMYKKLCGGHIETKVTFIRNGKTEQIEEYENIKSVVEFSQKTFEVTR